MKSWVSGRGLAAGIFALVLSGLCSPAFAAEGRTVGTYTVSPTGAATYTIPLWAPRGPNGLQPNIALVYNSQQGSGYVGVGWSVAGISSIYRCNLTYAQDGSAAPVALTTGDGLCLDGRRLRLTAGTPDEAGATYQTEVANFENVTAYGAAGNGPAYFVVQAPNGTQLEYGNTTSSQVLASGTATALQWYLDKVTDTAGNTMTFSYNTAEGAVVPATISWTPTTYDATTYSYTMTFAYGSNAQESSLYAYTAGTPVVNTNLLTSITVAYGGSTVKKYALTYQQSPTTGRDELTQVEECADSAQTNCIAPTTITYQSGQIGVSTSATSALSVVATRLKVHNDFNGDGLNDLAYCNGGSPGVIYVVFASGSGYGSPIDTGISCANPVYGDLTGSGTDGILAPNGTDWWYYTWNGSSFAGEDTGLAYDSTANQYLLADVNGDGLPDLIAVYQPCHTTRAGTFCNVDIDVRLNSSSGSAVSFSTTQSQWYTTTTTNGGTVISNTDYGYGTEQYGTLKALDFNGDGRQDLALETINQSGGGYTVDTYELLSGASSFAPTLITSGAGASYGSVTFLDFNSDGCTDYVFNSTLYISGCNGTVPVTVSLGSSTVIGAMDWDGDGRTDILVQNGSTIGVYLSEGDGISSLQSTSIPYSSANVYFAFDANGDGLDDLGLYASSGTVSYYLHNGAGQRPDLLSSVTDGYGNFAKPTYSSIAQGAYSKGTSASYPDENYVGPLYVVNQTTFSDPSSSSGGTYEQSFTYYKAWMNLQGRGFEGFGQTRTYDSRTGVYDYWLYNPAFPYTGTPTAEYYNFPTATTRYVQNTLGVTELESTAGSQRYFPYISNTTIENDELGGTENGEQIDTLSRSYTFDDYGNATQVVTTATDNDPGSPYDGDSWTTTITQTPDVDTSTWCLRLASEVQTAYSASDGSPSVTRTQDYSPDTTKCRYTQIQTAPSSSYQVTEALAYDDFGNVNSDTVTGTGMSARVTSANWGTTGQFPISVTDATGATTQFNYNFSYGLVSSQTDPNGLTTSWQYGDGFARLTQETRPDGTYTTFSYNDCVNWDGCPITQHTLALSHTVYNVGGSAQSVGTEWEDAVERPVLSNQSLLASGTYDRNEVRYDSLGRVVQRAFPCLWSAVTTPCSYWTTVSYDGLNRPTQVQRPINQSDSSPQTTSYAYAGDTTTITDPNENTRTLTKDVNGWPRQTKDAMGYAVTLGYDAAGTQTSVTDSLGNTLWTGTYAYGIAPFLVGESDVDRGTWGYTVDALGERTAWTDAKSQHFYETYDALSRPLTRTEPDLFTQWTWGSSAASHNIGKLASVCSGTGSTCSSSYYSESESYDSLGRPYQRSIAIPSMGTYTYTWQYSATTGLLSTLTYPTGSSGKALELQYAYQNGILQSITDILDSPNVTVWQADAQNPAGQITQETLGNGLVTNRAYDAVTQWLSSVQSGPGGGASIQNLSFLYDEVGDVTQRQDGIHSLSEDFYYDNDYRLSYSTLGGTQNLSQTYDTMGNITTSSNVGNDATWTYDPVHLHQVREAGSTAYEYAYDANGNMTSRAGEPITWMSYNYPKQITGASSTFTFSYAPDRSVWLETETGGTGDTTYRLGSPMMSIVRGSSGTTDRNYIYAGSEPVALDERTSSSNTFYYLLTDHQGSISGITNSSGHLVVGESFHPYGTRRNPTTWTDPISTSDLNTIAGITPRGYTFKETLQYMNLVDLGGRIEDAVTGRFLSADPNIPDPADPQSYNHYSYTVNNPLTYIDPTGFEQLHVECISDICSGAGASLQGAYASAPPSASPYPEVPWPGSPIVIQAYSDNVGDYISVSGGGTSSSGPGGGRSIQGTPQQTKPPQTKPQQGNPQQTKPPTQSKVCQYASSNPDASELAAVATTLGIDDNLVQAIEKADPSFSLPGFLGEAAPTVLSGAATGIAGGIIAGEVRQGEYLNATLDSMDMGLGLVASKAGGSLLLADTAFNALGGFKQLAKGAANVICTVTGGQ